MRVWLALALVAVLLAVTVDAGKKKGHKKGKKGGKKGGKGGKGLNKICHQGNGEKGISCDKAAERLEDALEQQAKWIAKEAKLLAKRDEICGQLPAPVDIAALEADVAAAEANLATVTAEQDLLVEAAYNASEYDNRIYFAPNIAARDACLASLETAEPIQPNEEECLRVFYTDTEAIAASYGEPFTSLILESRKVYNMTLESAAAEIASAQAALDDANAAVGAAQADAGGDDTAYLQKKCDRATAKHQKKADKVAEFAEFLDRIDGCFEQVCPEGGDAPAEEDSSDDDSSDDDSS